jgi:hypothetical protein
VEKVRQYLRYTSNACLKALKERPLIKTIEIFPDITRLWRLSLPLWQPPPQPGQLPRAGN